ncbi:substrate-binding domain-containing protein [Nonomuraea sp. K274]|uniref:Substrate-binding domain-containing protein n=1 Tax=Nonomuraea cypriaca TaxID=1187855 RepID=A0A931F1F3_9ACTN|nr:substrate-binding domain-containing protein [Nonomuraea cypriaca]
MFVEVTPGSPTCGRGHGVRGNEVSPPSQERPNVTMRMVASASGVHVSTVSRVLRRAAMGEPPLSETDVRILRIAADMRYVVNPNAASLTTKRSTAFGVLVPSLTDTVLATIYDSVENTAKAAGFETFVANTHDDPAEQSRRIELLLGRHVDGLILGDAHLDGASLTALKRRGVRFVLVSRRSTDHLSITGDDHHGGYLAGRHLAGLGHRVIGIVAGPGWASTSVDRVDGCVAGAADGGVTIRPAHIVEAGFEVHSGREGAAELLSSPEPPTAIFTVNDLSAIGVYGELRRRGLRPGHDVAVIGYNDLPLSAELPVPLTTLRSPLDEMGRLAVETLLSLLEGKDMESVRLRPELRIRESTRP